MLILHVQAVDILSLCAFYFMEKWRLKIQSNANCSCKYIRNCSIGMALTETYPILDISPYLKELTASSLSSLLLKQGIDSSVRSLAQAANKKLAHCYSERTASILKIPKLRKHQIWIILSVVSLNEILWHLCFTTLYYNLLSAVFNENKGAITSLSLDWMMNPKFTFFRIRLEAMNLEVFLNFNRALLIMNQNFIVDLYSSFVHLSIPQQMKFWLRALACNADNEKLERKLRCGWWQLNCTVVGCIPELRLS